MGEIGQMVSISTLLKDGRADVIRTIAYAKVGQAAAYICGYSQPPVTKNHQSPCPQEELLEAFQWISVVCTMGSNGWQEAGELRPVHVLSLPHADAVDQQAISDCQSGTRSD